MKNIYVVLMVLLALSSCEDQDYLHKKYLDEGEVTYIGKSGFVEANPGRYRIEAVWGLSKDPKALNTIIKIGDETITVINSDYATTDSFAGKKFAVGKYLMENLEEKDYTLKFTQTDDEGNTSLQSETFTTTYGSKYEARLLNQSIASLSYIDEDLSDGVDSIELVFNNATGAVGLSLKYKLASSGEDVTIVLPKGDLDTLLIGTVPGSELVYSTRYLPKNGIDTVSAKFSFETIPYPAVPKNGWSAFALADDSPDAYGWVASKLWDGSTGGSGYHTTDVTIYPVLFNVDLGTPTLVKSIAMAPRGGYNNRLPDNIEIWMSNSANEVGVTNDDAEWETKAIKAGWVKVDETSIEPNTAAGINGSKYYRYMRVRIMSIPAGGTSPVNMMEIYLTGVLQ